MAPSELANVQAETNKEPAIKAGSVEVRMTRSVLPNHLWIGIHVNGSNNGHS
jgi:hypothetical protein